MHLEVDRSDLHHLRAVTYPVGGPGAGRGPHPGRRLRPHGQQHHLRRIRRHPPLLGVLSGTGGGRRLLGQDPGLGIRGRGRVHRRRGGRGDPGVRVLPPGRRTGGDAGPHRRPGLLRPVTPPRGGPDGLQPLLADHRRPDLPPRARGPAHGPVAPVRDLVRGRRLPRRPRPVRSPDRRGVERVVQDGHRGGVPARSTRRGRRGRIDLGRQSGVRPFAGLLRHGAPLRRPGRARHRARRATSTSPDAGT